MNFEKKVALIVGGARMGQAIALQLAKEGCFIVLTYRKSKKSSIQIISELKKHGVRALLVKTDISKKKDVTHLRKKIMDSFGKLNFIINLASIYKPIPHEKIKEKDWDENINIHLKGGFLLGQIFQNILVKNHGRMIHFSDWVADSGRPTYKNYLSYYVSKKGIIGLTEAQALEMAPHVLVNAIAPGPILPPLAASKKVKFEVQKQTPLKKWGGVVEIVKTVLFLLKTDFITGECIRVDGGRHLI